MFQVNCLTQIVRLARGRDNTIVSSPPNSLNIHTKCACLERLKKFSRACVQIHLDPSPECTLTVSVGQGMFRHMGAIKNPANTCYIARQFEHSYQITTCLCTGISEDKTIFHECRTARMFFFIGQQGDSVCEEITLKVQAPNTARHCFLQGSVK